MLNPTAVMIDAFVKELKNAHLGTCSNLEPELSGASSRTSGR
jgi:hypothetical protein